MNLCQAKWGLYCTVEFIGTGDIDELSGTWREADRRSLFPHVNVGPQRIGSKFRPKRSRLVWRVLVLSGPPPKTLKNQWFFNIFNFNTIKQREFDEFGKLDNITSYFNNFDNITMLLYEIEQFWRRILMIFYKHFKYKVILMMSKTV